MKSITFLLSSPLKKVIFLFLFPCFSLQFIQPVSAQDDLNKERILAILTDYLQQEYPQNSSAIDKFEWTLSDVYRAGHSDLTHVYIQQTVAGLPIFNAISVFVLKDDKVEYARIAPISGLSAAAINATANLSATEAITAVLDHLKRSDQQAPVAVGNSKNGHFVFDLPTVSSSPIDVHLTFVSIKNELKLAWNVTIEMKDEPHWWSIRIDAMTGAFLEKNDFTVQCQFSGEGCSAYSEHRKNETHIKPQVWAIPMAPPLSLAYNVYPLPIEAPSFGGRNILTDAADHTSSPFDWHDTDGSAGPEYTITRGNNAYAYEDADNDNLPGYSPDGGPSLFFDFDIAPNVSPIVNKDAALTNMFVQTNMAHDVLYHLGFDEAAGNFQENNYGNGGNAGDVILAEGFDGSGMNNANFSTPPDGSSPRMQMYLWSSIPPGCTSLNITSSSYTGPMNIGTAIFTPSGSVTADLKLVDDGVGTATDACTDIVNSVAGKIVIIDRGSCSFVSKVQRAEAVGALAVIIVNNQAGPATNMAGSPTTGIPCLMVSKDDGDILKAALLAGAVGGTLMTCAADTFDSNFDNGIIVHEFGHGVSSRLTGGPSQASCLTNIEQASEGWSDWLALMLTIESGDNGTDARGLGTYVMNQSTAGVGIRRFPYSTDMNVNPQTYGDLATSEETHEMGEIWCDAIWDMSWLLMAEFGFNSDPTVDATGNNMAIKLVLTGMKLQPCNPGFLDSRDGILAADVLLYGGTHTALIWQAFARRGMGCSATQGSANAIGDETEAFDEPDPYFLDADNDGYGDASSAQTACSAPSNHVANSDDCDDSDDQIGPCLMWTGTTDSDWNTATNWAGNTIPDQEDDVFISSAPANQPVVNTIPTNVAKCKALLLEVSSDLQIAAGKALTISGTFKNNGVITVKANATGIGSLITTGTISGNGEFIYEQYLTGANNGGTPSGVFYYVASPVVGATASDYNIASSNKLWSANETMQSYPQITVESTILNACQGYVARMRETGTISLHGTSFNTGNVSVTGLTRTGTDASNRGYNLMGNPYPSTVSWDDVDTTNLFSTIWYRTHQGITMLYDAYNGVSGTGTNNNLGGAVTGDIPPTQAFWVRVKGDNTTASVNFTNAMRSHGALAGIYKTEAESGTVRMTLSNGTTSDEAIVMFDENADDAFDSYDSQKMWAAASVPQLYMNELEDSLVINGLYSTATNPVVDLGVKLPTAGNYTLNANSITITGETVFLEDRVLNIFQDLNVEPNYGFTSVAGNVGDRFALHFGMNAVGIGTDAINRVSTQVYTSNGNILNIILPENMENATMDMMDMSGRTIRSVVINTNRYLLNMNTSAGVYLVRITTTSGTETHRIVLN